jgi:hypothetical protein
VTITAQRKRAAKVGGTITPLIQNNILSFVIGMSERPVWMNQYKKKQRSPAAAPKVRTSYILLRKRKIETEKAWVSHM